MRLLEPGDLPHPSGPAEQRQDSDPGLSGTAKIGSLYSGTVWIALWRIFAPLPSMVGGVPCPTPTTQGLAITCFGQGNVRRLKIAKNSLPLLPFWGTDFPSGPLNLILLVTCSDQQNMAEVIRSGAWP